MKLKFLSPIIVFLVIQPNMIHAQLETDNQRACYTWAVVGAGLAGITALAVLIDCGIDPSTIAWIDPEFNVGRVGKYYRNVPGNVQTSRLLLYVNSCPYFNEIDSPSRDALYTYNADEFQLLHVIADPLNDFTTYLSNKVTPIKDVISSLEHCNDHWVLSGTDCIINAQKVVLAIGAEPKKLNYGVPVIPLDDALDKNKLAHYVNSTDCVAVFGGMHSALLILKYLSECSVKHIVNFYIDPYFYGPPGLEGATALWAKTVLEQNPPKNLVRVLSTPENRAALLPLCTKAIYAIGYEPSSILVDGSSRITFDEDSGIIAQDLYGIGIAFPPTGIFNGQKIAKNGLMTYLAYAKKLIPEWITNERTLFTVDAKVEEQEIPWI